MYSKRYKTKTELVTETLRENIRNGKFSAGTLPSKLEIASFFDVSHRTVDIALKILKDEGLIRGVRGTGIFVNREPQTVTNLTQRLILQLSPRDTFYESEPSQSMRAEAFSRGYFPVTLPLLTGNKQTKASLSERASMTQLLRAPIQGVIFDGRSYWREPFLENFKNIRSVAIIHFDADCEAPGSSVLIDYTQAGKLLAQHMIANGARKLATLFNWIAPDVPKSARYWAKHPSHLCLNGIKAVTDAAGLPPPELHYNQQPKGLSGVNWEYLSSFDGIICASDDIAFAAIDAMKKLGKKVPEDILIAGQHETTWSYGFDKQITTLSLNPQEISKYVIDMLESGDRQTIYVKPKLIVRTTTVR